jgi:hypothetical protein
MSFAERQGGYIARGPFDSRAGFVDSSGGGRKLSARDRPVRPGSRGPTTLVVAVALVLDRKRVNRRLGLHFSRQAVPVTEKLLKWGCLTYLREPPSRLKSVREAIGVADTPLI